MTPDELRHQIRRRAGLKSKRSFRAYPVRIVQPRSGNVIPPTLRKLGGRASFLREVVVSDTWLRLKAPKLWAAFCAARILDTPDRLVISSLKEER